MINKRYFKDDVFFILPVRVPQKAAKMTNNKMNNISVAHAKSGGRLSSKRIVLLYTMTTLVRLCKEAIKQLTEVRCASFIR